MQVSIFTQDERVYLPSSVAAVIEQMPERVSCIVLSPAMSTHGGLVKGLRRHLPVFGLRGTITMGWRTIAARIAPRLGIRRGAGRYWSIEEIGRKYGIPTFRVDKVDSEEMTRVMEQHPSELLISISCPQIIPARLLSRFQHGGINVHSAPLPRYRGLMPGFWVLLHNERETAVTVHELAERLDNGAILLQEPVPIHAEDTWDSLIRRTKAAAGPALVEAIRQIEDGTVVRRENLDDDSTYFSFPTREDARQFRRAGRRMF